MATVQNPESFSVNDGENSAAADVHCAAAAAAVANGDGDCFEKRGMSFVRMPKRQRALTVGVSVCVIDDEDYCDCCF